jgi:hypothetical protein
LGSYAMKAIGRFVEPIKLAQLTECAGQPSDEIPPDGCCTWGRSHGQLHGKFSDLGVSRSLDAQDEREKVLAISEKRVAIENAREITDAVILTYSVFDQEVTKLVAGNVPVAKPVLRHVPVFEINGVKFPLRKIRVRRLGYHGVQGDVVGTKFWD